MFASIVASVLNVALNYLLIGPFDYVAAAYTTLLSYAFMAAAYPSSRRPTFDGGRATGMGTGSNAGSRCHGRPRLSNSGQPFS